MFTTVTPYKANELVRLCAYSTSAPEWEELVRAVTPVVSLAARRVCQMWNDTSNTVVSEIVQDVFLKLCEDNRRIMREFEDRGTESFFKLVRMITASVATDYFRRTRAEKRGGANGAIPLEPLMFEQDVADRQATKSVELPALLGQLDGLLRLFPGKVSARDRQLFWLYYRHGLSAESIALIPAIGLTAKGVESALLRMVRLLRQTVLEGKPEVAPPKKEFAIRGNTKGFARVIAIDTVKRHS